MIPENLDYTKEHEWIKKDGNIVTVGISDFAQAELGDIVFIELPEVGATLAVGDSTVTLESVKAVSSVYSPFTGTVVEINLALDNEPEIINSDPYNRGWMFKMEISGNSDSGFMTSSEYHKYIESLD